MMKARETNNGISMHTIQRIMNCHRASNYLRGDVGVSVTVFIMVIISSWVSAVQTI